MHTQEMSELDGSFHKTEDDQEIFDCPKCKQHTLTYKIWESSCGGYEDVKYSCNNCKHYYWVEGPDA